MERSRGEEKVKVVRDKGERRKDNKDIDKERDSKKERQLRYSEKKEKLERRKEKRKEREERIRIKESMEWKERRREIEKEEKG